MDVLLEKVESFSIFQKKKMKREKEETVGFQAIQKVTQENVAKVIRAMEAEANGRDVATIN